MKLNIEELAREAGAEFYAETIIVNGKDPLDFVEALTRLIVERCADIDFRRELGLSGDQSYEVSNAIRNLLEAE